jgi:hypothetical protein
MIGGASRSGPNESVNGDQAFLEALRAAGGGDHSWTAIVNVAVERDGLVRRYPFGEKPDREFLPSMGAILAGQYSTNSASFLIDFGIRTASIPTVSYVDVLRGDEASLNSLS